MKDVYFVLVIGNYYPEVANTIRSALTQKLLRVRTLTTGYAQTISILQNSSPQALGAMSARIARDLGFQVELFESLPSILETVDLVIAVRLKGKDLSDSLRDYLEEEFNKATDLVDQLDKMFVLDVPLTPQDVVLLEKRPEPQPLPELPTENYQSFQPVKDFRDKIVTPLNKPSLDRDAIPSKDDSTPTDVSKAGGLQHS